ncbi:MAG TPA: zf-HC2 domain-containing protein [Vicinamibacteria bacterium]|nr:zf-HC2 domain-containing protein [Vicinamibacteria bacterium]
MSDALPDVERLRAALRALAEDARPRADCPPSERLWQAVRAELPAEQRREIVDHIAGCPACAEAWRLAVEIDPDARPTAAASQRPWLAAFFEARHLVPLAASLLIATTAGVVLLRGPEGAHDPGYREAGSGAIRSLLSENEPVSRSAFRLRWSPGPMGTRYDVRVTTESLDPVASAQGLTEASFLVAEPLLASLPAGSRLLWQVQMRRPEGNRQDSPTFATLLR